MNMNNSIFSSIKPKLDMGLFVWFLCIYLFLPVFAWCAHKIVLFRPAEQFYEHIMQKQVKTGKYTEIDKQSHVKFWLNWIKHGAVSYSLSCTGYGLGRSLGDCRPALPEGRKYPMVKTKTESHDRRPLVWTNRWQIWVFLSFEFLRGTAGICHTSLWGFPKAL